MKIIGVCGGSGSGKGSLCRIFYDLGVPSVDTDAVYHELISGDTPCTRELVSEFGPQILKNGAVDRAVLGKIVFSDENKRLKLNSIAHKHVLLETSLILEGFRKEGYSYAIVDAPLLFESGFDSKCDFTVGVLADRETRISRITSRDNIVRENAIKRIDSQISDELLSVKCDFTVRNDGSLADLEREARVLYEKMVNEEI